MGGRQRGMRRLREFFKLVIPGRIEDANYDVQLHIVES
jgi:hypothetical protein